MNATIYVNRGPVRTPEFDTPVRIAADGYDGIIARVRAMFPGGTGLDDDGGNIYDLPDGGYVTVHPDDTTIRIGANGTIETNHPAFGSDPDPDNYGDDDGLGEFAPANPPRPDYDMSTAIVIDGCPAGYTPADYPTGRYVGMAGGGTDAVWDAYMAQHADVNPIRYNGPNMSHDAWDRILGLRATPPRPDVDDMDGDDMDGDDMPSGAAARYDVLDAIWAAETPDGAHDAANAVLDAMTDAAWDAMSTAECDARMYPDHDGGPATGNIGNVR